MHTTALRLHDFALTVDGHPATLPDLLPGFGERARLGIVLGADGAGLGAGMLVLAAVTAFYDRLRAAGDGFFAYPDYFAFHVGHNRGTLRKVDVWPDHKEVVVPADGEEILRAVSDRAVTHLLVPDGPAGAPDALGRETTASARRSLHAALVYEPSGQTPGADVTVAGSDGAYAFVEAMREWIGATVTVPATQSFRRVSIDGALGIIAAPPGRG